VNNKKAGATNKIAPAVCTNSLNQENGEVIFPPF